MLSLNLNIVCASPAAGVLRVPELHAVLAARVAHGAEAVGRGGAVDAAVVARAPADGVAAVARHARHVAPAVDVGAGVAAEA